MAIQDSSMNIWVRNEILDFIIETGWKLAAERDFAGSNLCCRWSESDCCCVGCSFRLTTLRDQRKPQNPAASLKNNVKDSL